MYHTEYAPPEVEGVCDDCGGELYRRTDDSPDTVRNRLFVYYKQTSPLVGYYFAHNVLATLDGDRDMDAVQADLVDAVKLKYRVDRGSAVIVLNNQAEIAEMREAGRIVARVHEAMREMVRPGVTTYDLDVRARKIIRGHNAIPAFLGYPHTGKNDYPASICASINEELVHGIPSRERWLESGDIISIDVGAIYKGWVGDSAWTYVVEQTDEASMRLLEAAEGSLWAGIAAARPHVVGPTSPIFRGRWSST